MNELVGRNLSPEQIYFAEWLALPEHQRDPKSQLELAQSMHVAPQTLCNWKKLPDLWEYRDSILRQKGKDLVPEALKKLEELLESDNARVALDAAKDILARWSEPAKHASIVTSLKDLYDAHNSRTASTGLVIENGSQPESAKLQ